MSVLKGEGRVPILFGTSSVARGPVTHTAYLARPDLSGEWPTIIVVPSAWGVTSAVKDICRRLARQGFAVIAPDPFADSPPSRSLDADEALAWYADLGDRSFANLIDDVVRVVTNQAGFWSSAERGFGLLGLGPGGRHAVLAAERGVGSALGLLGAALGVIDDASVTQPLLAVHGRDDERAPVDEVMAFRDRAPHGEFVLYEGVGRDFYDDYLDAYHPGAAADALERLVAFFEKELPPAP